MIKIEQAVAKKNDIYRLEGKDLRLNLGYFETAMNYNEYESINENIRLLLRCCPRYADELCRVQYWNTIKIFLHGVRYADEEIRSLIEDEEKRLSKIPLEPNSKAFYREICNFLTKEFIPKWVSKWEQTVVTAPQKEAEPMYQLTKPY